MKIVQCPVPQGTFLASYEAQEGAHTDCFSCVVPTDVSLDEFIRVFFSTPVFRAERFILSLFGATATSDEHVTLLAEGHAQGFAGWRTEDRDAHQLLMAVGDGPIRSWLMVKLQGTTGTQLFFGSALLPTAKDTEGNPSTALPFRLMMGFHKLYSRILLWSAARWFG